MESIAKAYVQIIPTTKGIGNAIEQELGGEEVGKKAGKSIAGGIGKGLATATGLVAAGVTAVSAAVVKGVKDTAAYADNIDKMSQKLGLSAAAYQEWDFIAQHSGTSVDGLQASMKTLSVAAEKGNDAFSALGLSMQDIQGLSQEDLFSAVISRLQEMGEGTERTAIASALLGRSATELAPLLNTSAEATEEMRKQAHELGGVLSDDAVKAGAAFQDSVQNLQTAISGMTNSFSASFLPAVTGIVDGLTALASGDDSGLGLINNGLSEFLDNIINSVPIVAETATSILMSIVNSIIENLPKIIDSGFDIVLKLIDGIVDAIPRLLEMLPTIITRIVVTFADNLPKIINIGMKLLGGLASGLIRAIPALVSNIPKIISAIAVGLMSGIGSIAEVGANLVRGLWNGISNAKQWVLDKIAGLGSAILSGIKGIFGIHSPSTETAWMGDMLMSGLANGIEKNANKATNAMRSAADSTLGAFGTNSLSLGFGGGAFGGGIVGGNSNNVVLNVYGAQGQDVRQLANIVMNEIQSATERRASVFA